MEDRYFRSCACLAIDSLKRRIRTPQDRKEEEIKLSMMNLEINCDCYDSEVRQTLTRDLDKIFYNG